MCERARVCERARCLTSCRMVSWITLSQSEMMLSVSYCIRYSQPCRVFSCGRTHSEHVISTCNHGDRLPPCGAAYLQNVLLGRLVFGGPAHGRSSEVDGVLGNDLRRFALRKIKSL